MVEREIVSLLEVFVDDVEKEEEMLLLVEEEEVHLLDAKGGRGEEVA